MNFIKLTKEEQLTILANVAEEKGPSGIEIYFHLSIAGRSSPGCYFAV